MPNEETLTVLTSLRHYAEVGGSLRRDTTMEAVVTIETLLRERDALRAELSAQYKTSTEQATTIQELTEREQHALGERDEARRQREALAEALEATLRVIRALDAANGRTPQDTEARIEVYFARDALAKAGRP